MIGIGTRVTYLDSGYTGRVVAVGTMPAVGRYAGAPGVRLRWDLLDERTGLTVADADGGEGWVPLSHLHELLGA